MSITVKSFVWKFFSLLVISGLVAIFTVSNSVSGDTVPAPVAAWYEALRGNDAGSFEQLLAPDATIELRDLSITQTKAEFIDSLDEWANANKDASIETRMISKIGETVTMKVCYTFPSNQRLDQETFTIADGRIVSSVQEMIAEDCKDF